MEESANGVELQEIDGLWVVSVIERGQTVTRSFETRKFAQSWAAGQQLRLRLKPLRSPVEMPAGAEPGAR